MDMNTSDMPDELVELYTDYTPQGGEFYGQPNTAPVVPVQKDMDVMEYAVTISGVVSPPSYPVAGQISNLTTHEYAVNSPENQSMGATSIPATPHSQCSSSTEPMQIFEEQLPGMHQLVSSPSTQPSAQLVDFPTTIRFRYESEKKPTLETDTRGGTGDGKPCPRLEISNYIGNVTVQISLVDGGSGTQHVNQLYMCGKKINKWTMHVQENCAELKAYQNNNNQYHNLPTFGVMRMKKNENNGRATPSNSNGNRMATDRVTFQFLITLCDMNIQLVIHHLVTDSKSSATQGGIPKIVHVNPRTSRALDETEVTILCENINAKSKVVLYSMDSSFRKEASVTYRHKKCALVVKTPKFNSASGGHVYLEIVSTLSDGGSARSDPFDFQYTPETDTSVTTMKRSHGSDGANNNRQVLQRLKQRISTKRSNLQTDGADDEDDSTSERPEEEEEDEDYILDCDDDDVVDASMSSRMSEISLTDSSQSLATVAFYVAEYMIAFDECLCEVLAGSLQVMLTLNDKDQTPLASAILHGNIDVVGAFLRYMPEAVTKEVLAQRITESQFSHLLLAAHAKDSTKLMIDSLLKAGANLNDTDASGNSLLHLLIRKNQKKALAEFLHEAMATKRDIKELIDKRNSEGRGPLHEAVLQDQPCIVGELLRAGANVNLLSLKTSLTPLHFAVLESKSMELIKSLLETPGVLVNATTLEGKTALDLAQENDENVDIVKLLTQYGGEVRYKEEDFDEEDDEDEEEEDTEEEEEEAEENSITASSSTTEASSENGDKVSCDEMIEILANELTPDEFLKLAKNLGFSTIPLDILSKAGNPAQFFWRHYNPKEGAQLCDALKAIGQSERLIAKAARLTS